MQENCTKKAREIAFCAYYASSPPRFQKNRGKSVFRGSFPCERCVQKPHRTYLRERKEKQFRCSADDKERSRRSIMFNSRTMRCVWTLIILSFFFVNNLLIFRFRLSSRNRGKEKRCFWQFSVDGTNSVGGVSPLVALIFAQFYTFLHVQYS